MKKTDPEETLSPFEQELSHLLKASPIPSVPQEEIAAAARTAAAWSLPDRNLWRGDFWRAALASLTAGAASFWVFCAFLLGSGVAVALLWTDFGAEPLAVLLPLAPVPFLCFLIRELQIRDAALVQMERTCVWDPSQVCFARLWAGTLLDGVMVALSGLALGGEAPRFYLCAFTVLFFLGAIALFLLRAGGNTLPLSFLLAAWVLGAFWFLSQEEILYILQEIALPLWAGAAGAGLALFALASLRASKKIYA